MCLWWGQTSKLVMLSLYFLKYWVILILFFLPKEEYKKQNYQSLTKKSSEKQKLPKENKIKNFPSYVLTKLISSLPFLLNSHTNNTFFCRKENFLHIWQLCFNFWIFLWGFVRFRTILLSWTCVSLSQKKMKTKIDRGVLQVNKILFYKCTATRLFPHKK